MSQTYTADVFNPNNTAQTDLQNIENNFAALKSQFSGAGAPANPVAGMPWVDLTRHMLCVRNEANSAWQDMFDLVLGKPAGLSPSFPTGTAMLFAQTTAPTGWTKSTTHNDKTLRVVSGTASSGGSVAFSTAFGRTATDGHTLTTAQMPSHTHTYFNPCSGEAGYGAGGTTSDPGGSSVASGSTGSSGSHSHNLDLRVNYVDVIIATKD
jgi:hypothetical protein